jgi:hypothetical protein
MDIPSIKFKYFEKLKLWHDYLSGESIFENTKKEYWNYEKMILIWAYSSFHQHLYTSIDNNRIFEAFGYNRNNETKEFAKKEGREIEGLKINDKKVKDKWQELINKIPDDKGAKINYVMGNLAVKDLFEVTDGGGANYSPNKIRVTAKGLLLGELLFEGYCKNNIWKSNFRIYKLGYGTWRILIVVSIFTILWVFFNQFNEFIKIFF